MKDFYPICTFYDSEFYFKNLLALLKFVEIREFYEFLKFIKFAFSIYVAW